MLNMKKSAYSPIQFNEIDVTAKELANKIRLNLDKLKDVLIQYESFEVVDDEIGRTLDLLENLHENREYFDYRVGEITVFLPRNQPLYSFTCFVIIPSLMSSAVHFRIPESTKNLLPKVFKILDITNTFPNINASEKGRLEFLKERSVLLSNPATGETLPLTEAVIFTGTPKHAEQLRLVFDKRTLFITNGAGHNPIIVADATNLAKAVDATLTLTLYNQGQDCAAPNSILVHENIFEDFVHKLTDKLKLVNAGNFDYKSCRVGPISNPDDLPRVQSVFVKNRDYLHKDTPGVIRTYSSVVEPTVIQKPLSRGGNYEEMFAPILFIQKYEKDENLASYFETKEYQDHAMYITLYGESEYVKGLINKKIDDVVLHTDETFLHNKHLHEPGVERGTKQYGGNGIGASNLSINGKIIAKPTLPQRDIYEHLIFKKQKNGTLAKHISNRKKLTKIIPKNVEKILKLQNICRSCEEDNNRRETGRHFFIETDKINADRKFIKIDQEKVHTLLHSPNIEAITDLSPSEIKQVMELKELIIKRETFKYEDFKNSVYAIPKKDNSTKKENLVYQFVFFKTLYKLLFNKDRGPRLIPFLWEVEVGHVDKLIDV